MPRYRITTAARVMGVSEETVRRWVGSSGLPATTDRSNAMVVEGADLAAFAQDNPGVSALDPTVGGRSARNRLVGIVTAVVSDRVMTQVEMQCGPHRVVSLISTEAATELELQPGTLAVAIVKSTDVVIETPQGAPRR